VATDHGRQTQERQDTGGHSDSLPAPWGLAFRSLIVGAAVPITLTSPESIEHSRDGTLATLLRLRGTACGDGGLLLSDGHLVTGGCRGKDLLSRPAKPVAA